MEDVTNTYKILVGEIEESRLLRDLEVDASQDLRSQSVDYSGLARGTYQWLAFVDTVMNLGGPVKGG
jgi:hypothetical protein